MSNYALLKELVEDTLASNKSLINQLDYLFAELEQTQSNLARERRMSNLLARKLNRLSQPKTTTNIIVLQGTHNDTRTSIQDNLQTRDRTNPIYA